MKILQFFKISITKTLLINFHYFGFRNGVKLPILVSKKTIIRNMNGNIIFRCPLKLGLVQIGFHTLGFVDYSHDRSIFSNDGTILFNGHTDFGSSTKIFVYKNGVLDVGKNVSCTGLCRFIVSKQIKIGDDCLISWDVQFMDTDFHKIINPSGQQTNQSREIIIGNHVWIGCKCTILKGTNIPDNCILSADSLFNHKLNEKNSIYGGCHAHTIKNNIQWKK